MKKPMKTGNLLVYYKIVFSSLLMSEQHYFQKTYIIE